MAINIQDIVLKAILSDMLTRPDSVQQKRGELALKQNQRADDLSDLSLLTEMLDGASTEPEIKLLNETNKEVQKRAIGKDPVIQAKIRSADLQVQEDTTLFNQFKEMLKTKSVLELKDILSKNIGLPFGNERSGVPIIYDM